MESNDSMKTHDSHDFRGRRFKKRHVALGFVSASLALFGRHAAQAVCEGEVEPSYETKSTTLALESTSFSPSVDTAALPRGASSMARRRTPLSTMQLTEKLYRSSVDVSGETFVNQAAWTRGVPMRFRSSAFVVGHRLIMLPRRVEQRTDDIGFVSVKKFKRPKRYEARVLGVSPELGFAFFTVDDDEFWSDMEVLKVGKTPQAGEEVYSVTESEEAFAAEVDDIQSVQSQPTSTGLWFLGTDLMTTRIRTNSKTAGYVFNKYGHLVAAKGSLVKGFIGPEYMSQMIRDLEEHGKLTGLPSLGIYTQPLQHAAAYEWSGLGKIFKSQLPDDVEASGVRVRYVDEFHRDVYRRRLTRKKRKLPLLHGEAELKDTIDIDYEIANTVGLEEEDLILAVEGRNIDNMGRIHYSPSLRVDFPLAYSGKFQGDLVSLLIVRRGQVRTINAPLIGFNLLLPVTGKGGPQRFFTFGGLVFVPKSQHDTMKSDFKQMEAFGGITFKRKPNEEIIMVREVLPNKAILNEKPFAHVAKVNGKAVANLKELATAVDAVVADPKQKYVIFESERREVMMIDKEVAARSEAELREKYGVAADRFLGEEVEEKEK